MTVARRAILRTLAVAPVAAQFVGLDRLVGALGGPAGPPSAAPAQTPLRLRDLTVLLVEETGRILSEVIELAAPVSLVAFEAPPGTDVAVRVGTSPLALGDWHHLPLLGDEGEGPDGEEALAAGDGWERMSRPLWVDAATVLQVAVDGASLADVEVVLHPLEEVAGASVEMLAVTRLRSDTPVWRRSAELTEPDLLNAAAGLGGLQVVTRSEWGANESWRGAPSYASGVHHGVVHHTVNANDYSGSQGPALVRSIYRYHTQTLGWKDIGYNALVDRYGVIYEGRYGGLDRPVIGAHASGANTGSFGVALIGDFRTATVPTAARDALLEFLAAKFELHGIDPEAVVTANGSRVPTLAGHGDMGTTSCPGTQASGLLAGYRDALRRRVHQGFSDIAGHPYEEQIETLRVEGVTSGFPDGTYRPDWSVDRGQMATFLTRAARLAPGPDVSFKDLTPNHPHYDAVCAVVDAGVAQGYPDGTYRPSAQVTRGQMATFIARTLGLPDRLGLSFVDVLPTHPHYGAIEAVVHAGVAQGYDDRRFRPERPVTRGQMAVFLVRALFS